MAQEKREGSHTGNQRPLALTSEQKNTANALLPQTGASAGTKSSGMPAQMTIENTYRIGSKQSKEPTTKGTPKKSTPG